MCHPFIGDILFFWNPSNKIADQFKNISRMYYLQEYLETPDVYGKYICANGYPINEKSAPFSYLPVILVINLIVSSNDI